MAIDARKTIEMLGQEWDNCTQCDLSQYRPGNVPVLIGGGEPGGFMFIGAAPTASDESNSAIYTGEAQKLLLDMVDRLQLYPAYFTNMVGCRSCAPVLDAKGEPRRRIGWKGEDKGEMLMDQPPSPLQLHACRARVLEEIYIVDPLVIVALGQVAASALLGSSVNLRASHGVPFMMTVPGAGTIPLLSGKKQVWERKVKGVLQRPTAPFPVRYHVVPTYDPTELNVLDTAKGNLFDTSAEDLKVARSMHRRYHEEVTGIIPTYYTDPDLRDTEEETATDGD